MRKKNHRAAWQLPLLLAVGVSAQTPSLAAPSANVAGTAHPIDPQISAITLGVRDLQLSYRFYKDGLGLPARGIPGDGIVFFTTTGTKLFLYPYDKLAEDARLPPTEAKPNAFHGFTLGHAVRTKGEVDRVLALAVKSGGKLVKGAHDTSWGGCSGYFSDPDGYLWEVLYAPNLRFAPDGTVVVP